MGHYLEGDVQEDEFFVLNMSNYRMCAADRNELVERDLLGSSLTESCLRCRGRVLLSEDINVFAAYCPSS